MCDGQYRDMQNYLREQNDNLISVNVVGEVALFIQNFSLHISKETMDLMHLILQSLIEMCVGNHPNKLVIYNRQIIEALNQIFSKKFSDEQAINDTTDKMIRDKMIKEVSYTSVMLDIVEASVHSPAAHARQRSVQAEVTVRKY